MIVLKIVILSLIAIVAAMVIIMIQDKRSWNKKKGSN